MATTVNIIMLVISILLITVILVQVKGQGTTLFGSAQSSFRTRRGMELALFRFTLALVAVFIGVAIISAWQLQ